MNEDEKFYKKYYDSRQNPDTLKTFLSSLDMEDVHRRHLLIPELPETIPPRFEDAFFFHPDSDREILAVKHNRYSPAIFHAHTFFELFFVYDGKCRQNLMHTEFEMHSGDVCMIPPGIEHAILVDNDSIVINVLIHKDTLHNIFYTFLNSQNIISSFLLNNIYAKRANDYIIFHTGSDYEIRRAFLYMLMETANQELYHEQMIGNTLSLVFGLLIRNYENTAEMPVFESKTDVQRFALLQYIQDNYNFVCLEDVAARFHYTPEYTSRLIRETTGMTFTEIVHRVRIEHAQDMLAHTNLSISAISANVGYEAPEYFIRLFKKRTKMTPAAYRKQYSG